MQMATSAHAAERLASTAAKAMTMALLLLLEAILSSGCAGMAVPAQLMCALLATIVISRISDSQLD
jgi:hypothetical protein